MTTSLLQFGSAEGGNWHIGITALPIRVRKGDMAQAVSMISIQKQPNGAFLWWDLLVGTGIQGEVVNQVVAKTKEILEMDKHPRQIFMDNGQPFKGMEKQLKGLMGEQQLLIDVRPV